MLDLSGYSFGSGVQQSSSQEQKNKIKAMRRRYIVFYILGFAALGVSAIEAIIILITGVPSTLTWLWLTLTILLATFCIVGVFISINFRKERKRLGADYSKQNLSISTYLLGAMIALTIVILLVVKIINPDIMIIK